MIRHTLIAASLMLAGAQANAATILTQWNFNSMPSDNNTSTGTLVPNIGMGTASLVGGVTASFASGDASGGSSDPVTGNDSGWQTTNYAAATAGNKTRGVEFDVSTVGKTGVVVSFDQRHSNTAARHVQFQYSTNGTTFVDFGAPFAATAGDAWFNNRTVDLSSVAAVNNNPLFSFRMVAAFAPGGSSYLPSNPSSNYGTTGTMRFDMVTVSAVPEPETYAMLLAGLGLVASIARRRRAA